MKSIWMRWAGSVANVGDRRGAMRFWWGDLRERTHLEDVGLDERIILRLDLQEVGLEHGLHCSGWGQAEMAGCCKCSNESSFGFRKMRGISCLVDVPLGFSERPLLHGWSELVKILSSRDISGC
jgi:hypothetical protein